MSGVDSKYLPFEEWPSDWPHPTWGEAPVRLPSGELAAVTHRLQDGRGVGRVMRVREPNGGWREPTLEDQAWVRETLREEIAANWKAFDEYHAARARMYREFAAHCSGSEPNA